MVKRICVGTAFLILFACLATLPVYGQGGGRATINGTVTDQSGAVVPGARITITNTLTGHVTTVTTTSTGGYSVPFLQVGKYNVAASREGFATETRTGLTLNIDQIATVNFALKPGTATTNVEVKASAAQIDTTSGAISQVITEKAITDLPLNGRNPAALVWVAPGAVKGTATGAIALPGSGIGSPQETSASVNASRMGGVSYRLDGITHMNNYFQTASPFPNPDATQEFRVITNNFDAQYGYSGGVIVDVTTRSGTNTWHGGVFEFLRNDMFNAKGYFNDVKDTLKRNQFGGELGGPIVRDKLFIFGNVQFTRERVKVNGSSAVVPNNTELTGDFSALCESGFDATGLCKDRDPNTNTVIHQLYTDRTQTAIFPNNYINPSLFVPFSLNLEKGLPHTDAADGFVRFPGRSQKNDGYEYTLRGDYHISSTQTVGGHVFIDHFLRPAYDGNGNYLASDRSAGADSVNVTGHYTWMIHSNLVNDFRMGYNRANSSSVSGLVQPDGKPVSPSLLGANLPSYSDTLGSVGTNGFGISQIPVTGKRHNWVVDETISLNKGKHSIKAGLNVFTQYSLENATWEADPLFGFNGSVTGNDRADFLLGDISSLTQSGGEFNEYHSVEYSAYGQDSIKLKPNLTVNLGVRWEPQIAPIPLQNKIVDYWPGFQSTTYPNALPGMAYGTDPGVPHGGWANQWGIFLPRISVAWSPLPKTVVRSAFGLMVLPYTFSFYNHQGTNAPFSPIYTVSASDTLYVTCTPNIMDPFACYTPTGGVDPYPPFAGPDFIPPADSTFIVPQNLQAGFLKGFRSAREVTWNLSIEHTVGDDLLLGITYIGRQDSHVPIPLQMNPGIYSANPAVNGRRALSNYSSILQYASVGTGSYNGFQVRADKHFSHGFQFTSNFSWSKALDTSSVATISNVGSVANPFCIPCNYGISDLDIPLIWNNTFIYQMPYLHSLGWLGSAVLGGWEVSGIWTMRSGGPFSIYGGNGNNASAAQIGADRADRVPGQKLWTHRGSQQDWLKEYFNTDAFTFNAPGTFGDSGRNLLHGPGWNNLDMMLAKNFLFHERFHTQFRWEMYNALNHPNFGIPSHSVSNGNFGQITGASAARVMQLGLKLNF